MKPLHKRKEHSMDFLTFIVVILMVVLFIYLLVRMFDIPGA